MLESAVIPLCHSADLSDGGLAVPFDVIYGGQTCRAFAIRFKGVAHAYLNRCSHVAMEMDFQPNRFLTQLDNSSFVPHTVPCTVPILALVRAGLAMGV